MTYAHKPGPWPRPPTCRRCHRPLQPDTLLCQTCAADLQDYIDAVNEAVAGGAFVDNGCLHNVELYQQMLTRRDGMTAAVVEACDECSW